MPLLIGFVDAEHHIIRGSNEKIILTSEWECVLDCAYFYVGLFFP